MDLCASFMWLNVSLSNTKTFIGESLPEVKVLLCGHVELYHPKDIMEIKFKFNKQAHNYDRSKVKVLQCENEMWLDLTTSVLN